MEDKRTINVLGSYSLDVLFLKNSLNVNTIISSIVSTF